MSTGGTTLAELSQVTPPATDWPEIARADKAGAALSGVIVFSDRAVIAQGVVGLLPERFGAGATVAATLRELESALESLPGAAIVDGGATFAADAASAIGAYDVPLVLLLDDPAQQCAAGPMAPARAVIMREEVGALSLALGLGAALADMRLLSSTLAPAVSLAPREPDASAPSGRTLEALTLVAKGCRDAEIALRLNISESAARKHVQRAVRRLGARTRAEAVAKAVANGCLD